MRYSIYTNRLTNWVASRIFQWLTAWKSENQIEIEIENAWHWNYLFQLKKQILRERFHLLWFFIFSVLFLFDCDVSYIFCWLLFFLLICLFFWFCFTEKEKSIAVVWISCLLLIFQLVQLFFPNSSDTINCVKWYWNASN